MTDIYQYLELTNTVQLILMIRDMMAKKYQVSTKDYETYLNSHLDGVKNLKNLLELVNLKITADANNDMTNWSTVRNKFDLENLVIKKTKTHNIYIHFHVAPNITLEKMTSIKNAIRPDGKKEPSCIGIMHIGLDSDVKEDDVQALGSIIQIDMYRYLTKIEHYKTTMFNISSTDNTIHTINKILMAREIVCQMIEIRQYRGNVPFIYFNNLNAELGHFKLDLESRYMLGKNMNKSLYERNYFDIFGITKVAVDGKTQTAVYIHFLIEDLKEIKDFNDYLHKLEEQIRATMSDKDSSLYIIVILEPTTKIKEQYDYQITEDLAGGAAGRKGSNTIVDVMPIKNLQYNPITNVYQPKFRLIKSGTAEHKQIVADYGSEDAIPRINQADPVNIFYGGKHRDIYEIIRNQVTLVGDEKDSSMHKNPQLHFDVAHRLVR